MWDYTHSHTIRTHHETINTQKQTNKNGQKEENNKKLETNYLRFLVSHIELVCVDRTIAHTALGPGPVVQRHHGTSRLTILQHTGENETNTTHIHTTDETDKTKKTTGSQNRQQHRQSKNNIQCRVVSRICAKARHRICADEVQTTNTQPTHAVATRNDFLRYSHKIKHNHTYVSCVYGCVP